MSIYYFKIVCFKLFFMWHTLIAFNFTIFKGKATYNIEPPFLGNSSLIHTVLIWDYQSVITHGKYSFCWCHRSTTCTILLFFGNLKHAYYVANIKLEWICCPLLCLHFGSYSILSLYLLPCFISFFFFNMVIFVGKYLYLFIM